MILKFRLVIFFITIFSFLIFPDTTFAKAPEMTRKELSVAPPRIIRTCCGFGVEIGIAGIPFAKKTDITSREIMGSHHFLGNKNEKNGIVYTRRGGFLDLGHLRDCADYTAFMYNLIKLSMKDSKFIINEFRNEGGDKSLTLRIPENASEEKIIQVASRIAYDQSLWHEISTWFGARYVPMISEEFSSFSPEDMYSNLMGVHLGMRAIKSDLPYNEAMTEELSKMLDTLQSVNTEAETFAAMSEVNNVWYTNIYRYPSKKLTLKRNFDFDTTMVPWRIPSETGLFLPYILNIPDPSLDDFFQLSIKLNYRFPIQEIFCEKDDDVITQKDFDTMIEFIKNAEKNGTPGAIDVEKKKEKNGRKKT